MEGKDWLRAIGWTAGLSSLFIVAIFILTGGTLEIERIFGKKAQEIRYNNRQASPEVIEGKKQVIDQAWRDLCDPNKAGFQTAAKRQILDAARELDNLSVLPADQKDLVKVLRNGTFKCNSTQEAQ